MCTVSIIYRTGHVQESPHELFKVSSEEMGFHSCLHDIDRCSSSNIVGECIPGLRCGYSERSRSSHVFRTLCSANSSLFAKRIFPLSGSYGLTRLHK